MLLIDNLQKVLVFQNEKNIQHFMLINYNF